MSVAGYKYQCPRCRGYNRYTWPELMRHYQEFHQGVIKGERG